MLDITSEIDKLDELLRRRKHLPGMHDQSTHTPKAYGSRPKGLTYKGGTPPLKSYEMAVYTAQGVERGWLAEGAQSKESGAVIDADGNVVWESDDSEEFSSTIYIPPEVPVKGNVFTHYHPPVTYRDGENVGGDPDGVSQPLSPSDIRWAVRSGQKEIRCVGTYKGTEITVRAYHKGRGWPSKLNYWLSEERFQDHVESYRSRADSTSDSDLSALSYEAINDYWDTVSRNVDNFEYEAFEPLPY